MIAQRLNGVTMEESEEGFTQHDVIPFGLFYDSGFKGGCFNPTLRLFQVLFYPPLTSSPSSFTPH